MGKIHLNRNRQSLGQFTPEEVAAGLKSGRFLPTDLAWREGMDAWKPLGELTDLPVVAGGGGVVEPVGPPGASPPERATAAAGVPSHGGLSDAEAAAAAGIEPAWERRKQVGFFAALFETIRQVLGAPGETFAKMSLSGGLGPPLLFYVVVAWVAWDVSAIYQLVFTLVNPDFGGEELKEIPKSVLIGGYAVVLVIMPVLIALHSFLAAGIWHLCLMLLGAGKSGFEATYRVVCYAGGATSVFALIPLCGGLVQFVWLLVALVIGFKETHRTETARSAGAVVLPVLICCACGIAFYSFVIFGMVAGAAAASQGGAQ